MPRVNPTIRAVSSDSPPSPELALFCTVLPSCWIRVATRPASKTAAVPSKAAKDTAIHPCEVKKTAPTTATAICNRILLLRKHTPNSSST